jgi:hypothetical protein
MTLLSDILDWSTSELAGWQQDALRRLFEKGVDLTEPDYCELYDLFKLAHGIRCETEVQPRPLSHDQLPVEGSEGERVVLKAMSGLANVNRLPGDQVLSFAPEGITIIYGPNASGKSGYARVLKRACRARDQVEMILPDATQDPASTGVPSATLEFESGGSDEVLHWVSDTTPPSELSRLSVFDSKCARVYVTEEQDVAYLPYGLDVVQNLADQVLPELSRRLDYEVETIPVDKQPFEHLLGDTSVGRLVAGLCDKTSQKEIDALASLSDGERGRMADLQATLAEADPLAKARDLRLTAKRMKELSVRADAAWAQVSAEVALRLQTVQKLAEAATEAERVTAELLRSGEKLLPGTGEAAWKALLDAASRFSLENAYPDHAFPNTDDGAVCLLCQQPLTPEAGPRLTRFAAYVTDDAAEDARAKQAQLAVDKRDMARYEPDVAFEGALADEVASIDADLAACVRTFAKNLEQRKTWILGALDDGNWSDPPPPTENPRARLRRLAASLLWQARHHEEAADSAGRERLRLELAELEARNRLSACAPAVESLVERMKARSALDDCKKDLRTRRVSDKAKEFASSAVTDALRSAMEAEFAELQVGHVRVALKERIERGKIRHRLVLDLPLSTKLNDVLSEGEQRAIALGSFMAELSLTGHRDGIVFDDPVSSLDHGRRRQVARRLVQESARRQVIVFTHDTSFLGLLRDEIEERRAAHSIQHLEWIDDRPGRVCEGLPWEHEGYRARIDSLEKEQRRLERLPWPIYPNEEQRKQMTHQYDMLRATIERAIQDVIFAGVVQRYRDWIRVDQLDKAVGFEEPECRKIRQLHKRCCRVVDAHDPSSAKDVGVPSAADLKSDIKTLCDIIEEVKKKRVASTSS